MYPKLKFQLNKKLDKKVCKEFLKLNNVAGLDFRKNILAIHQKLKNVSEEKINEYIDKHYRNHKEELLKKKREFEKLWEEKSRYFFKETAEIFKNYQWPKGKYICYLSIFPCCPRFLEDKTFQSFYKYSKKILLYQIAHEMLHFIFYDYLYRNYPKYKFKKYNQRIWEISEAFNQIIQNQMEWINIQRKPILAYPKLKTLVQKMKKIWQETKDIDYLLNKILPK